MTDEEKRKTTNVKTDEFVKKIIDSLTKPKYVNSEGWSSKTIQAFTDSVGNYITEREYHWGNDRFEWGYTIRVISAILGNEKFEFKIKGFTGAFNNKEYSLAQKKE